MKGLIIIQCNYRDGSLGYSFGWVNVKNKANTRLKGTRPDQYNSETILGVTTPFRLELR